MQWRNWPVLAKLAAVLVVPVIAAAVLGVLRVTEHVERAEEYAEIERLATLRSKLVPVVSVMQRERIAAVQYAIARNEDTLGRYEQRMRAVDVATAGLPNLVGAAANDDKAAADRFRDLTRSVGGLQTLRQQARTDSEPSAVIAGYTSIITKALDFDHSLAVQFEDQVLAGTSATLYDLQVAREQVSLQQVVVLPAINRGELLDAEREIVIQASVRMKDRLDDCRAVAPPGLWRQYVRTVFGPEVEIRQTFVQLAREDQQEAAPPAARGRIPAPPPKPTMPFSETEWNAHSDTTGAMIAEVALVASGQLRSASASLEASASNRAGTESVLLVAMVLLAAAVGGVVGRYLLRSLGLLRRTALEVASTRLPAAVANIRQGRTSNLSVDPVPLRTTEEFGQLARAFDAVNAQAVRSAAEEASLRSNLRNVFVNLSRRSQGLVERQLRLMEQLEQKENDPDQLANLFKLDHLATRMRRNNENLMVLSGQELGRRSTDHMAIADVLRAAISEVEQYQRAVVQSAPLVDIVGYAAGDLVRSIAELVENATTFSPPDSQVIITSQHQDDGSVLVEILDLGIGMGEAELQEANQRVAAGGSVDVPVSRQMGLFVVGNLANRHGIKVELSPRPHATGGLRAAVQIPAELVAPSQGADPEADELAPAERALPNRDDKPAAHGRPARPAPVRAAEPAPERVLVGVGVDGLSARLQSAGIFVRLRDLPPASSPASILFQSEDPGAAGRIPSGTGASSGTPAPSADVPERDFAWLGSNAGSSRPPARPVVAEVPVKLDDQVPGELPKRVPRAQLAAEARRSADPTSGRPTANRDPNRARGLLSSFQAGVRQSRAVREDNGEEGP
jgi:signal transduction histidine kinase